MVSCLSKSRWRLRREIRRSLFCRGYSPKKVPPLLLQPPTFENETTPTIRSSGSFAFRTPALAANVRRVDATAKRARAWASLVHLRRVRHVRHRRARRKRPMLPQHFEERFPATCALFRQVEIRRRVAL